MQYSKLCTAHIVKHSLAKNEGNPVNNQTYRSNILSMKVN